MAKYTVEYLDEDTREIKTKDIEAYDVKRTGKESSWTDFLDRNGRVVESMKTHLVRTISRTGGEDDDLIGIA